MPEPAQRPFEQRGAYDLAFTGLFAIDEGRQEPHQALQGRTIGWCGHRVDHRTIRILLVDQAGVGLYQQVDRRLFGLGRSMTVAGYFKYHQPRMRPRQFVDIHLPINAGKLLSTDHADVGRGQHIGSQCGRCGEGFGPRYLCVASPDRITGMQLVEGITCRGFEPPDLGARVG